MFWGDLEGAGWFSTLLHTSTPRIPTLLELTISSLWKNKNDFWLSKCSGKIKKIDTSIFSWRMDHQKKVQAESPPRTIRVNCVYPLAKYLVFTKCNTYIQMHVEVLFFVVTLCSRQAADINADRLLSSWGEKWYKIRNELLLLFHTHDIFIQHLL